MKSSGRCTFSARAPRDDLNVEGVHPGAGQEEDQQAAGQNRLRE
jgi:hypothetical protein